MSMSFDPASIFLNLVISFVGLGLFMYGRKADRWPHLTAGLVLMVYPYVVGGPWALAGIGLLVVAALLVTMWLGW